MTAGEIWVALLLWGLLVMVLSITIAVVISESIDRWQERSGHTSEQLQRYVEEQWRRRKLKK